jgi:hypothetical protein
MPIARSVDPSSTGLGRVYRPRWSAEITVPIMGTAAQRQKQAGSEETLTFQAQPRRVRIERNDHNQADACSIELDWTTAGVDARMLDDAIVEVHVQNADDTGYWFTSTKTCRFVGVVKEVDSHRTSDGAATVALELVDYTALFLTAKPFGSGGVPSLSMTLSEAWQKIVGLTKDDDGVEHENTPGTRIFRENPRLLVCRGVDPSLVIGKGVPERFRKIGKVQTKPDTDAWAVWQQCVGMLGLLSYIDKDTCVVTTATNYYTEQDAPTMIWGSNLTSWHENRASALARKGVALTSFDPLSLRAIEAFWPPIGDPSVIRKRSTAKKVQSEDKIRPTEERDYFAYPGVQEYEALLVIAKRVYEERSRQELEGSISTPDMYAVTEQGEVFDLLELRAGDTVRVEIEPGMKETLAALSNDLDREQYLIDRGYADSAAELIVANMKNFEDLDARFLTKRVGIEMEVSDDGGSFSVDIDYVNRIQIDGSANV